MTQGRYNIPLVPDIVPRQRLLTLFDRHESCRVFLLTGQAAQGKSTLVASFLKGQEQPSLWCHLTAEASDHTRLFEILINGIHELFREQEQIQKIQIPQTTLGTREDLFRQIETLAMSFLKEKKYALAKEAALMAVNELGVSKRGDIHYFLAKQIHGFSLFYTGDFVAAQRELEAVLAYFSRISSDLYFCETSFILGLICLGIKAENKDKDKNSEQTYLNVGISKAMGNQYTYFPLLDLKTLAQVLVQINLIPSGRALSPGTIENQDLASYFVLLVSRDLASYIRGEIIQALSFGNKKERARRTEQLKYLYKLAQPKIRINTLGEFNVWINDTLLDKSVFEGAKPISLLKAIVMNGSRDIPKEILIDALWPDASASAGKKNFKINLHRLRKGLEPSPVKEFGYAYVLQKSGLVSLNLELVCLDVDLFLALGAEAVRLESGNKPDETLVCYTRAALVYKGDYFVEDPYLEWLGPRRDLFRSKYIEILKKKGLLHEEMDQWSEAVDTWRVILGTDPFFEAAYRNLMILYADAGRKSEALHVFKECRGILNRELDTEPEFQTQQIYARIKKL